MIRSVLITQYPVVAATLYETSRSDNVGHMFHTCTQFLIEVLLLLKYLEICILCVASHYVVDVRVQGIFLQISFRYLCQLRYSFELQIQNSNMVNNQK